MTNANLHILWLHSNLIRALKSGEWQIRITSIIKDCITLVWKWDLTIKIHTQVLYKQHVNTSLLFIRFWAIFVAYWWLIMRSPNRDSPPMQYWTASVSANIRLDSQQLDIVAEYTCPSCINFHKYLRNSCKIIQKSVHIIHPLPTNLTMINTTETAGWLMVTKTDTSLHTICCLYFKLKVSLGSI